MAASTATDAKTSPSPSSPPGSFVSSLTEDSLMKLCHAKTLATIYDTIKTGQYPKFNNQYIYVLKKIQESNEYESKDLNIEYFKQAKNLQKIINIHMGIEIFNSYIIILILSHQCMNFRQIVGITHLAMCLLRGGNDVDETNEFRDNIDNLIADTAFVELTDKFTICWLEESEEPGPNVEAALELANKIFPGIPILSIFDVWNHLHNIFFDYAKLILPFMNSI